jgi:transposase
MEYGAIDLHTRRSQIRIVTAEGTPVLECRIDTRADAFRRVFANRSRLRIVVESSTESEWVARELEALGHEVIVADPTYAAMYGSRTRRIKTDRRDVAALADACRRGIYRPAHRVSATMQHRRQQLRTREHLIRMRTQTINAVRAILRQAGVRVPSGMTRTMVSRVREVPLRPELEEAIGPLLETLDALAPIITRADAWVRQTAAHDPVAQHLMTVPGVGGVVALTYQAALDAPARFGGQAGRASAYLGLVPGEHSSGERQRKGAITKSGPRAPRALLVQAAWTLWRTGARQAPALHAWVEQLAARRGRRIAVTALARRLSRILYALWRDDTVFVRGPIAA